MLLAAVLCYVARSEPSGPTPDQTVDVFDFEAALRIGEDVKRVEFKVVSNWTHASKSNFTAMMFDVCEDVGMLPVCNNLSPANCGGALFMGQAHRFGTSWIASQFVLTYHLPEWYCAVRDGVDPPFCLYDNSPSQMWCVYESGVGDPESDKSPPGVYYWPDLPIMCARITDAAPGTEPSTCAETPTADMDKGAKSEPGVFPVHRLTRSNPTPGQTPDPPDPAGYTCYPDTTVNQLYGTRSEKLENGIMTDSDCAAACSAQVGCVGVTISHLPSLTFCHLWTNIPDESTLNPFDGWKLCRAIAPTPGPPPVLFGDPIKAAVCTENMHTGRHTNTANPAVCKKNCFNTSWCKGYTTTFNTGADCTFIVGSVGGNDDNCSAGITEVEGVYYRADAFSVPAAENYKVGTVPVYCDMDNRVPEFKDVCTCAGGAEPCYLLVEPDFGKRACYTTPTCEGTKGNSGVFPVYKLTRSNPTPNSEKLNDTGQCTPPAGVDLRTFGTSSGVDECASLCRDFTRDSPITVTYCQTETGEDRTTKCSTYTDSVRGTAVVKDCTVFAVVDGVCTDYSTFDSFPDISIGYGCNTVYTEGTTERKYTWNSSAPVSIYRVKEALQITPPIATLIETGKTCDCTPSNCLLLDYPDLDLSACFSKCKETLTCEYVGYQDIHNSKRCYYYSECIKYVKNENVDIYKLSPTPGPTGNPSPGPTGNPSPGPTGNPSPGPTGNPSPGPTGNPSPGPTGNPSPGPTGNPSPGPTGNPSPGPTGNPSPGPTGNPSPGPTGNPSPGPTGNPSPGPTGNPSPGPTGNPSPGPTGNPSPGPTGNPSPGPTGNPSPGPTGNPSPGPTGNPSPGPTGNPSPGPTGNPSPGPTGNPSPGPTRNPSPGPTGNPSPGPTGNPSPGPTGNPSPGPTGNPSPGPTGNPSPGPTGNPSPGPTGNPSPGPTGNPSPGPTGNPSPGPTGNPSPGPTGNPSPGPTENPSPGPTGNPSPGPTGNPSPGPTGNPSPGPTGNPSPGPTGNPSPVPTGIPSPRPTGNPSPGPTGNPSPGPTGNPTPGPTGIPSPGPTGNPSPGPTGNPSPVPTGNPSPGPTGIPALGPTGNPTPGPTGTPSPGPTGDPTPGSGITAATATSGSTSPAPGAQPVPSVTSTSAPHLNSADSEKTQTTLFVSGAVVFVLAVVAVLVAWKIRGRKLGETNNPGNPGSKALTPFL